MWTIYEKRSLVKQARKLPKQVLKAYMLWKRVMEWQGPQGVKSISGFKDEALKGDWKGCRSSRLNIQWRVIYKIDGDKLDVYVIEITPHKY